MPNVNRALDRVYNHWLNVYMAKAQERWDAGDTGCGQLVFELRRRMNRLRPGESLEVIAHDAGAPVDLPAWCRMTGHKLVSADHPVYRIECKPD